ncbi:hypothetical protein [Bacillus pumilus]|uniref:hypothetical protein n=1 Tax=Bacillus pumilus TaxID=1408 RepID=UPI0015D529BD|nr:hypothetical protein [Bacillus pumilus]QLI76264.1 hypothetical protein HZ310_04660 [Bacillus pumilus]
MAEEKRTIHVLKDEKLGIDREYVAVARNAEVGEKIVIVEKSNSQDPYNKGDVFTVDALSASDDWVLSDAAISDFSKKGTIFHTEYHVLEPTDIVHSAGERYRLEDREAEVGEKVMYVNNESGESDGVVAEVSDVGLSSVDVIAYEDYDGETVCGFSHDAYRVLTPVQDAAEAQESDVITVLANLGAEVAELKRTVARHQAEINALHEDKVRLGEQLATLTADIGGKTELNGSFIAEVLIGLKKAGL